MKKLMQVFRKPPAPPAPTPLTSADRLRLAENTVQDALSSFKSAAQRVQLAKTQLETVVEEETKRIEELQANKLRAQNNIAKYEALNKKLLEFTI